MVLETELVHLLASELVNALFEDDPGFGDAQIVGHFGDVQIIE